MAKSQVIATTIFASPR